MEVSDIGGVFETHLTVTAGDHPGLDRWATAHGFKHTVIVLDRGSSPRQPMLTRHGRGTLGERVGTAREWARALGDAGYPVVRLKIEVAADNPGAPRDAAAAAALPECYFEHHVKVLLDGEGALPAVRAAGAPHGAHLSRNARRHLDGGRHERFLTQRCRGVGRGQARARLDALLAAVAAAEVPVLEIEEEFVVHDDNLGLDAGWIDGR